MELGRLGPSLAWPDVPEKATSGHYCQHSVIQCNFISVTSHHTVTRKNIIAKRLRAVVTGRLMTVTKDWDELLPPSI